MASGSGRCSRCSRPSSATGVADEVVAAAAGVELTHLASLYHDDVMDEAEVRRGAPSANAKYDNSTAILVGDLLFGKASELVAGLGAQAVLIQAQAFVRLCAGQIRDDRPCPPGHDPVDYYLGVLADKTGVAHLDRGALRRDVRRQPRRRRRADGRLRREARGGVPAGRRPHRHRLRRRRDRQDARHRPARGRATPWRCCYARRGTDPADARLRELLAGDLRDDDRHAEALALLRANPALEQARETTRGVGARGGGAARPAAGSRRPRPPCTALATSVVDRVG